jgi:hypothetical protein
MPKDERNEQPDLAAYEQKMRERLVIDETSQSGLRWNSHAAPQFIGKSAGKIDCCGYWQIGINVSGKQRLFFAHRVAWFLASGRWPKEDIDHINCNRADNRLSNLREASRSENRCNSTIGKNNSSGVKGVCFEKRNGKWRAQLKRYGKPIHLGYFTDIADAEKAVMSARKELHGEFANHGIDVIHKKTMA